MELVDALSLSRVCVCVCVHQHGEKIGAEKYEMNTLWCREEKESPPPLCFIHIVRNCRHFASQQIVCMCGI